MAGKKYLSCIDNHKEITISLKTMKTRTCENQYSVEKYEKNNSKLLKPLAFLWKLYLWSTECLFQANGIRIIFG